MGPTLCYNYSRALNTDGSKFSLIIYVGLGRFGFTCKLLRLKNGGEKLDHDVLEKIGSPIYYTAYMQPTDYKWVYFDYILHEVNSLGLEGFHIFHASHFYLLIFILVES